MKGGNLPLALDIEQYRLTESHVSSHAQNDSIASRQCLDELCAHILLPIDEEALQIAAPAYHRWYASLIKLWVDNNLPGPGFARSTQGEVTAAIAEGSVIAGSPETVCARIAEQIAELGVNYFTLAFYFGNIAHEDAMRSLGLFTREVRPHFADGDAEG